MRILVIEDDGSTSRLIRQVLEEDDHDVVTTDCGSQGLSVLETWDPELIFLDLGLPEPDGSWVLGAIGEDHGVPLVALAAQDVDIRELQGRAHVARREKIRPRMGPAEEMRYLDLTIDDGSRRVLQKHRVIDLSKTEYRVLHLLVQRRGKVVSQADLARIVWNRDIRDAADSLERCIHTLRRKLQDDAERPRYIETVPGIGYRTAFQDGFQA
jgi:two-component system KDP operon response regulator KdpE